MIAFLVSSAFVFAVVSAAGAATLLALPAATRSVLLGLCASGLFVVEFHALIRSKACVIGPRRQVPKMLAHQNPQWLTALMWGLDSGTALTTYRFTTLPWLSLLAVLLGRLSWTASFLYSAGFGLVLALFAFAPSRRSPEPVRLLIRSAGAIRTGALAWLGLLATVFVVQP